MPDPTNPPQTPAATDPAAKPAETPAPAEPNPLEARLATLEAELKGLQSLRGKWSQEVGYLRGRNKELEQLAFNQTEPQAPADTATTPAYGYQPQPSYQPYAPPPPANIVTRDEFDLWRARNDIKDEATFSKVRSIAQDSNQVGRFIKYIPTPDGRAVASVYDTYMAIHDGLQREAEKKELEALRAQSQPNRNPALATISGGGAASIEELPDISNMSAEELAAKFPDIIKGPMYTPPQK